MNKPKEVFLKLQEVTKEFHIDADNLSVYFDADFILKLSVADLAKIAQSMQQLMLDCR